MNNAISDHADDTDSSFQHIAFFCCATQHERAERANDMKTIMILGAGRGQVGLYKAAREMGHKSVAVSIRGDYPGFALADEIDYTDITDPEAVLEAAKRHGADAVVSACVDITVPAIGYVCDKLGLCGITYEAAVVSTNKMLMKKAFEKYGVRTARFIELKKGEDAAEKSAHLNKPVIVKAVDLCGSKGINIVKDGVLLEDAVKATMSETKEDYCIIEEYLEGYEFSATAFVTDGDILFDFAMGDVRYGKNEEIPAGHYLPFEGDEGIIDDTITQMTNGIRALGLDNCAVNADLMISGGKVYILEMTGRLGANGIPELTSIYMGYDINRMIIEMALGERDFINELTDDKVPYTPCFSQMMLSERSGILERIEIDEDCDADITLFVKPGDEIRKFACTSDCIGQIITQADTYDKAKKKAEETLSKIKIVLRGDN